MINYSMKIKIKKRLKANGQTIADMTTQLEKKHDTIEANSNEIYSLKTKIRLLNESIQSSEKRFNEKTKELSAVLSQNFFDMLVDENRKFGIIFLYTM